MRSVLVCLQLCMVVGLSAHRLSTDSIQTDGCRLKAKQLIVPATLIAVGSFGVSNGWFCGVKENVKDGLGRLRGDCHFRGDDYLQYLPAAANLGLGFLGVKSRHSFRERVAVTATAYMAMAALVNVTKYTVREARPDVGRKNSFPSGHTATAFVGAELVRSEYGNAYGAGAYAVATGVAFLRLYNNKHWLNDVVAGAGIGILSARIGYWLLPWERRLLGWDKSAMQMCVIPAYEPYTHSVSVAFAASF